MRRSLLPAVMLVAGLATSTAALDANYWTEKYGTRSLLLSGAVIGSVTDLSSTFYNPGAYALTDTSGFLLTVKALEFSSLELEGEGGLASKLDDSRSGLLPSFLAGRLPFHISTNSWLAYSVFTSVRQQADITGRTLLSRDVLPAQPGDETLAGEVRFEQDLDETWGGITWSARLGPRLGVGLSSYVVVRNQRFRRQVIAQALAADSVAAATVDLAGFEYQNGRLVWKAGVLFGAGPVNVGLTATTPGVNLWGSGSAGVDKMRIGQGAGRGDEFAVTSQEDAGSRYESPPSLGGGVEIPLSRTTVYLSGEWFDAVEGFEVIDVDDFVAQGSGELVRVPIRQTLRRVVNWAVGIDRQFSPRTTGYLSFGTDYSGNPDGQSDVSFSTWDAYLVTVGAAFRVLKADFTLGVAYAFGSNEASSVANFDGANVGNGLVGTPTATEIRYRSLRFIFGFEF